jgi:hypothetical protein
MRSNGQAFKAGTVCPENSESGSQEAKKRAFLNQEVGIRSSRKKIFLLSWIPD